MKKLTIIILLSLTSVVDAQELTGFRAPHDITIQERCYAAPEGYQFHVGDTIVIDANYRTYLTGETMSSWVYEVPHVIERFGKGRFADGILVEGIISWIPKASAKLIHLSEPVEEEVEEVPVVEEDTVVVREMQPAVEQPVVEQPVVGQPAVEQPVVEQPVVEQPVVGQPKKDSTKVVVKRVKRFEANRYSIGLRGGVAELLHGSDVMKNALGWDAVLDLQYAHYWRQQHQPAYGIVVGASVGYLLGGLHGTIDSSFVAQTDGGTINYHVSATDVSEIQHQLMVEIPVMFSLRLDNGFFCNVGPRFAFPVWTKSRVTLSEPMIEAHFVKENVTVCNEVITGKISDDQNPFIGKWQQPAFTLLLAAEIGYEIELRDGNMLGIGAYGGYGVCSLYRKNTDAKAVVDVVPPSEASPAVVNLNSPSDVYSSKMGMFDAGLKLTYHIHDEWLVKKKSTSAAAKAKAKAKAAKAKAKEKEKAAKAKAKEKEKAARAKAKEKEKAVRAKAKAKAKSKA